MNEKAQAFDCDMALYAHDSCLISRYNTIKQIKKNLNKHFHYLYDRFVFSKLDIYFGENKTEYVIFR